MYMLLVSGSNLWGHGVNAIKAFQHNGLVGLYKPLTFVEEWLGHFAFIGKCHQNPNILHIMSFTLVWHFPHFWMLEDVHVLWSPTVIYLIFSQWWYKKIMWLVDMVVLLFSSSSHITQFLLVIIPCLISLWPLSPWFPIIIRHRT